MHGGRGRRGLAAAAAGPTVVVVVVVGGVRGPQRVGRPQVAVAVVDDVVGRRGPPAAAAAPERDARVPKDGHGSVAGVVAGNEAVLVDTGPDVAADVEDARDTLVKQGSVVARTIRIATSVLTAQPDQLPYLPICTNPAPRKLSRPKSATDEWRANTGNGRGRRLDGVQRPMQGERKPSWTTGVLGSPARDGRSIPVEERWSKKENPHVNRGGRDLPCRGPQPPPRLACDASTRTGTAVSSHVGGETSSVQGGRPGRSSRP